MKGDGKFDKNNLFKQSWDDVILDAPSKSIGDSIQAAKKYQAHSYMSSYAQVDQALATLQAFDSKLTFDAILTRAATKAFTKVFKQKQQTVTVNRIDQGGKVSSIQGAEKLSTGAISKAQVESGKSFSESIPAAQIDIHQLQSHAVVEALPITNPNSLLTLHYT